jgi:hypothetical protein
VNPAAIYLTLAGGYVTVTNAPAANGVDSKPLIGIDCEACGPQVTNSDAFERHLLDEAERYAAAHAARCRKLPARLWPPQVVRQDSTVGHPVWMREILDGCTCDEDRTTCRSKGVIPIGRSPIGGAS